MKKLIGGRNMSSTDKEKEMIKAWAIQMESHIEEYDIERKSFWEIYEDSGDIEEYDFENITELKKKLEKSLKNCEGAILPLCVATFKKKDEGKVKTKKSSMYGDVNKEDFEIPEFIYVF